MKRAALALALLTPFLALPARAADAPIIVPTRDVDVLYQADQGGQTLQQRLRWDVKDQLMRVDSPSPGLWMLVNYRNRQIFLVSDAQKSILEMSAKAGPLPGQPGGANFVRRGTDQVAGLPCTQWQAMDSQGQDTMACLTSDGVLLRAMRGRVVLIQAQRVAYGPENPALFKLPVGYATNQAPAAAAGQQQ
ncbi:MAG: hypothetical protein JO157_00720 [Acetobacteraceae bacterium]|nr:hypothetical protein [Acetobacteraceae bacterium]